MFIKNETIRDFIETVLLSVIIIFLIYQFVGSMEVVSGSSMEPNFFTDERILVDRITPFWHPYARGEVVVLFPPLEGSRHFLKRIIDLPGDIVKIYECGVYISNQDGKFKLVEPYLPEDLCTSGGSALVEGRSIRLGDNEYLVLGDNRLASVDSRMFGLVTKKEFIGRVVFRFWPLKSFGFVK